jgi:hypothetical protein
MTQEGSGTARAESIRHEDGDEGRVTEWRFAPGAATGYHRHEFDYDVVSVTAARIRAGGPLRRDRADAPMSVSRPEPAGAPARR